MVSGSVCLSLGISVDSTNLGKTFLQPIEDPNLASKTGNVLKFLTYFTAVVVSECSETPNDCFFYHEVKNRLEMWANYIVYK